MGLARGIGDGGGDIKGLTVLIAHRGSLLQLHYQYILPDRGENTSLFPGRTVPTKSGVQKFSGRFHSGPRADFHIHVPIDREDVHPLIFQGLARLRRQCLNKGEAEAPPLMQPLPAGGLLGFLRLNAVQEEGAELREIGLRGNAIDGARQNSSPPLKQEI